MLKELRHFFGADTDDSPPGYDLRLAVAVLLVEVVRSDQAFAGQERLSVLRVLAHCFGIEDAHAEALLERAEFASRQANDFYTFTTVVNAHLPRAEKIALVERMWQLALLDGHAVPEEMTTISRVAGLLHLTHGEYIAAKMRARGEFAARMEP